MSGHSKFANIKHKKEKNDAKKGKIFTIIDTLVLLHNLSAIGPIMIENTGGINSNVVTKEIANEELVNWLAYVIKAT